MGNGKVQDVNFFDMEFLIKKTGENYIMKAKEYPFSLLGVYYSRKNLTGCESCRCMKQPYTIVHYCSGEETKALFDWDIEKLEEREREKLKKAIATTMEAAAVFLDDFLS